MTLTPYRAADDRYAAMPYRRSGRSGLDLPALSLGLWHNFGDTTPYATQRDVLLRAFDLGVTHLDLANNYGPPYGSAEENFGRHLARDLRPYRDELVISSKAGYDMWPGPYGDGGSRKYLLSSLDQSLARMGLDYVDIFYSHRPDPSVPVEETMGALHTAVVSGRALYAGISNYSPAQTREAARVLADLGTPLLIHQPSYSMFNRHIEQARPGADGGAGESLLDVVGDLGLGTIVFSPLAQGLLTGRYLSGEVPADSRAAVGHFLKPERIDETYLARARALDEIASGRGQSLAQLALSWVLRDERVTSALIGSSSVAQLEDNVAALSAPPLTPDELAAIEPHAVDGTAR
ncbi:aldo/keto reductase [Cellulomonas aerilata]|uniref:Glyceraldehyde 3-phosphate reductase n=1 Tax=Cellulomonas aerilata TaxID=515326 RepID=A0A512D8K2_9CELL|nr:aldo/keto reductase [Cellulomonas aerilata]GEO32725.1 glyceraldehyde 3-phosphate reductase [Cellulomonas aerilata]